ncbi:MAG: dCTP deaminase domain-containing protein [Rhizomicrobium sp.]
MTQFSTHNLVSSRESEGATNMAIVVSGLKLKEAVENGSFIVGGDLNSVESVKYDFHLGDRVLKAEFGQPKAISAIPEEERYIAPGETVFVLTKERLNLPRNMIATLIPKRKMAHGGISVLGGLSVDPEYKGVLVVGMHNFSSTRYQLRPGRKLIAAMFHVLRDDELSDYSVAPPEEINDFPDDLVDLISKYQPADLNGLQEQLNDTRRELAALKTDIANDKTWRDDFKSDLGDLKQVVSETSRNVTRLSDNLEKEATLRSQEDKAISDRITGMSNMFFGWNLARILIAVIVVAVIGAVVGFYISKWLAPSAAPTVQSTSVAPRHP